MKEPRRSQRFRFGTNRKFNSSVGPPLPLCLDDWGDEESQPESSVVRVRRGTSRISSPFISFGEVAVGGRKQHHGAGLSTDEMDGMPSREKHTIIKHVSLLSAAGGDEFYHNREINQRGASSSKRRLLRGSKSYNTPENELNPFGTSAPVKSRQLEE